MGAGVRYRCNACGNLTRFDVVRRARTREFWHFSLGGDASVEEAQTLEETIERVECRWCSAADQIEEIPSVGAEDQS
ncbi:MAG: hypothetical protein ACRDKS_08695 [Actinomycetota bacterium]